MRYHRGTKNNCRSEHISIEKGERYGEGRRRECVGDDASCLDTQAGLAPVPTLSVVSGREDIESAVSIFPFCSVLLWFGWGSSIGCMWWWFFLFARISFSPSLGWFFVSSCLVVADTWSKARCRSLSIHPSNPPHIPTDRRSESEGR